MSVSIIFKEFCSNLRMSSNTVTSVQSRYKRITKRINLDYWNSDSEASNSLYVGSYGRGTEIHTSDIDILVRLPYATYSKFSKYQDNGQSALLQEVRNVLKKSYNSPYIKADGQVIGINFTDKISFEVLPAFVNKDGSYTHPDSNNGGSWKKTDPKKEIEAINNLNNQTNKNLKRLCRMARTWKDTCNVPMSGILIDTLAYKFLSTWKYNQESYVYYDWMSRDFFKYLMNLSETTQFWLAPGSNRYVWKTDNFQAKAKKAYNKSLEAIEYSSKDMPYTAKKCWREVYGTKFPS